MNLTGSGNETAAHLLLNERMTIMFCAFEGSPLILRLYGTANIFHKRDDAYQTYIELCIAISFLKWQTNKTNFSSYSMVYSTIHLSIYWFL